MTVRYICPDCDAKFHDSVAWRDHQEVHYWESLHSEDDQPPSLSNINRLTPDAETLGVEPA